MTVISPAATIERAAPDAERAPRRPSRTRRRPSRVTVWALAACAVLACAVLAWGRLTPTARDTLWAEDGRLFLADAERHGLLLPLFTPYGGYLQAVPRIIAAAVVQLVPVAGWAEAMTAASCLVAGLVSVVVFFASRAVVPPVALRVVLAAVTVLLPLEPREVLGSTANLHSVLMWGLFWALLARPATRWAAAAFGVFGLLAALSEIQAVFLLPLMAIAWRRARHGPWLVAGPLVGVAAQLLATVLAPRSPGRSVVVPPLSLAEGWVVNAVMPDLAPLDGVGRLLVVGGIALGIAALAGVLALAVVAWRRATADQRVALAAAAVLSPLIYVVSVLIDPATYYDYASLGPGGLADVWLTRYGVVPGMLLLGMVIVSAAALGAPRRATGDGRTEATVPTRRRVRPARVLAWIAVVAVVACLVVGYTPSSTRRADGPAWSPQIAAAARACAVDPSLATVSLNETLGWKVPVQCARLVGGAERG